MNFTELQTEVGENIIDAPPVIANSLPRLVNRGMRWVQTRHNFYVMEATFETAVSVGQRGGITRPADWKAARSKPYVEFTDVTRPAKEIVMASNREAWKRWADDDTGEPEVLAEIEGITGAGAGTFDVWPLSDGEYNIYVPYWRYLPDLSLATDTNWITTNAAEAIIAYATALGFMKDWNENRAVMWKAEAQERLNEAINADKRRHLGAVTEWVPTGNARAAKLGR